MNAIRGPLLAVALVLVVHGLSSCDVLFDDIPKGSLSEKDLYGNWECEFSNASLLTPSSPPSAKATVLIRKGVYRVRMRWEDGTTYDSDWQKWEVEYSDISEDYRLTLWEWADYLYSNYREDSADERTTAPTEAEIGELERNGQTFPIFDRKSPYFPISDNHPPYYRVTTNDGTIRPEDQPPAKGGAVSD